MRDFFNTASPIRFLFPIDGDCLNERDGEVTGDTLLCRVRVQAPSGHAVRINGTLATEENGHYCATLPLAHGKYTLLAKDEQSGEAAEITVYYLTRSVGKYRISSDDNILFLADITANKDVYTSIFDNPYLAIYKKAHDLYGAKVHLNLFYAFDPTAAAFASQREAFDLSMMTDKFREEWRANADWLRLSFHARTEFPDKPYQYADAATVRRDYEDVRREVVRFAGEECFADITTVHWGETSDAALDVLREAGHRALTGYFERKKTGECVVAYHADEALTDHVGERDLWVDHVLGLTFGRIDLVLNLCTKERLLEMLEQIIQHPHRGGFVSIMIHEQYFYEDYKRYLPDFEARVLESAKLLFSRGYQGTLMRDLIAEIIPQT